MRMLTAIVLFVACLTNLCGATGQEQQAANAQPSDIPIDDDAASVAIHVAMVEFLSAGDVEVREIGSMELLDTWLKELGDARKLLAVTKIDISTVDDREAMTQFGERAAVVSGRTRVAQGRGGRGGFAAGQEFPATVASYQMVEIGTIVRATPHLRDDGTILVVLQVEKSDISPLTPQLPPGDDDPINAAPASVVTISTQSTLRLEGGRTHAAFRKAMSSPQGMVESVLFVTAVFEEAHGRGATKP